MKYLIILLIFISSSIAKECYNNKVSTICYYRYFSKQNIYKAKSDEDYYIDKKKHIYVFDNIIEVRFKSIGGIFEILNNYDVKFYDKIKKEIYLFKVNHPDELFSLTTQFNKLKSVMIATPQHIRKYTKSHMRFEIEAKKARFKKAMLKAKKTLQSKHEK